MESMIFDDELPKEEEPKGTTEDGTISSEEEGFMQGYTEEEEITTCDECGVAIHGTSVTKVIDGETHRFCSEECAKEFAEGIS